MHGVIFFAILFVAKVVDNALSTAKTILIQRSRWIIAGVIVMLSDVMPSKGDIGASATGGAAVPLIIPQKRQQKIDGILEKPVEKFTKILYNKLDKSEFAGVKI